MKKGIVLIIVLAMCAGAQETLNEIRREIKKVEQETAREKELHQKEKQRHAEFVKSSQGRLNRLQSQTQTIKAQTDSLTAELARVKEARRKLKGTVRWYEKKKEDFAAVLADQIDSVIPHISTDFPYKIDETQSALKETAAQLRRGVIGPEEGLGRTWSLLMDRVRLGYTAETWSGYLKTDGSQGIAGKYLRYGAVFGIFVSQDGESVYYLQPAESGWHWKSAGDDLELRRRLKDALKVAEGKAAPSLVPIPLYAEHLRAFEGGAQ